MTSFALLAALLLAVSLAFIVFPLISVRGGSNDNTQRGAVNLAVLRDQLRELEQDLAQGIIDPKAHAQARHDLEIRVAQEVGPQTAGGLKRGRATGLAIILSATLIGMTLALYNLLGNPAALDPANLKAPESANGQISNEQVAAMLTKLEQHLKASPGDTQGWNILARTYAGLGKFDQANQAYGKLLALKPTDAAALSDAADALAMSQGRTLQGAPEKLLQRALQADPNHIKALILLGSAKFERKDYAGAAALWRQMQAQVPPQSQLAQQAEQNVQEAIRLAQAAGSPVPAAIANPANPVAAPANDNVAGPANNGAAPASAGKVLLRGTVQLDPEVAKQVAPGDTVFVFARAPEGGPKFPLAVLKKQVQDLPLQFSFDDSNSMMPSSKLSDFKQVVVSARISKSGQPIASKGDWEGSIGPVSLGGAPVVIVINKQHP